MEIYRTASQWFLRSIKDEGKTTLEKLLLFIVRAATMTYQGCVPSRTAVFVAGTASACSLVLFRLSPEEIGGKPQTVEIISDAVAVEKQLKQVQTCPGSTRRRGPVRIRDRARVSTANRWGRAGSLLLPRPCIVARRRRLLCL